MMNAMWKAKLLTLFWKKITKLQSLLLAKNLENFVII